ncbi:MAG: DUF1365 domain-containing protein, partial [Verrucomicrobiales bacterium]|nr:DUF1365 domain-containing protein [Verrucomicrobiales bacterium]
VNHTRLHPKRHSFDYRIFYLDLDLDELPTLHRKLLPFSHNRHNLFSFFDRDHLAIDTDKTTLRETVAKHLKLTLPDDAKIRLITLPRIFGYVFNPVSFFFVCKPDGSPLHALVEVGNTFKELKTYPIPAAEPTTGRFRLRAKKYFYVSPFSPLDAEFDFRLPAPGISLDFHIDTHEDNRLTLSSHLHGQRRQLTTARLLAYTFLYPLLTLKVIAGIHFHALLLWLKRIPFHRKNVAPESQTEVLNSRQS